MKGKKWAISPILVIMFLIVFLTSVTLNIKLAFSQQKELMNVSFEGEIVESDAGKIIVDGFDNNIDGFRECYQIFNSNQIKIVDENEQYITFTDLKPGMYISMRLWVEEIDFEDMDVLTMVTYIKCSETKAGLDEEN